MAVIILDAAERGAANFEMRQDTDDFNRRSGSDGTWGVASGCRTIGSTTTTPSHYICSWENLTQQNGRKGRWIGQMAAAGITPPKYDFIEGKTMAEALEDSGLELIPVA